MPPVARAGQTAVRGDLARGLRTTAAHSTLTLADLNSTAILADGTLGKGVTQVEIDRREIAGDGGGASRLELSHDGYVKRHGFAHRRLLILANNGKELRGVIPDGVIDEIISGLRSSCTYAGARSLEEFAEKAVVGIQSASGYAEGRPLNQSWRG